MKHTEADLQRGFDRYEKARKLNPPQWRRLYERNLAGEVFDDMIDALPPCLSAPDAQPVPPATPLIDLDALGMAYADSYASPHHMTFSVSGLRNLIETVVGRAINTPSQPAALPVPAPEWSVEIIQEPRRLCLTIGVQSFHIDVPDFEPGEPDRMAWFQGMLTKAMRRLTAAQPVPQEHDPIYQYQMANGHWIDQDKENYDYNVKLGQAVVRVLYASPQITQPAALPVHRDFRVTETVVSQPSALPAYGVEAAIERLQLCGMTSNDVIVVEIESIRAELLAAAGSKTP